MNNAMMLLSSNENATRNTRQAFEAGQLFINGMIKYFDIFLEPLPNAINAFINAEQSKPVSNEKDFDDFSELMEWNFKIAEKNIKIGFDELSRFGNSRFENWSNALIKAMDGEAGSLGQFYESGFSAMKHLTHSIDKAIEDVEESFGFKFKNKDMYIKIAETQRFELYQILPTQKGIEIRESGKPVLLIPPYVLGPNILAFLPDEGRSYSHSFANRGIPTYVRVVKNINDTHDVQVMTGEDDVSDTKYFCEFLSARHGSPVTLNGYCQGGFIAMAGVLTGELDETVDTLITCVAPLDGTRSPGLTSFLKSLPERYQSLDYAKKILENGNPVIDGKLMGWVFKLKGIEKESPFANMMSDLKMVMGSNDPEKPVPKIAAAINRWICGDRTDLPFSICSLSFASYTKSIDADGNLPFELFGKKLNIRRIQEKKINFQICYAEKDDLVEKSAALAPLDFIEAETAAFPKGHGAIATSWSKPDSPYPLDGEFNGFRGPVKFHLDMEARIEKLFNQNAA